MNFDSETSSSVSGLSTAEQIEYLSARIIEHIRTHNWSHPDWETYVAENFQVYVPDAFLEPLNHPSTSTRDAYINTYKTFTEANPDYDCDPVSIDADVDEHEGTAKVWIIMSVTGHPPSVRKESVSVLHWVKVEDRWIAVKQTGLRGFRAY